MLRKAIRRAALPTILVLVLAIGLSQKCSARERPNPHDLAPDAGSPSARRALQQQGCKKLLWFTTIHVARTPSVHTRSLAAALMSQKARAPSLIPHLMYSGIRDEEFLAWYTANGGTVHYHEVSFANKLEALVDSGNQTIGWLNIARGAYLRIDLPIIMKDIATDDPNVATAYVLYTDVDVLFWEDLTSCSFERPAVLSLGPEHEKGRRVNSGVMFINVAAFDAERLALIDYGVRHQWPGVFDQTIITAYFGDRITLLSDLFNWKGYWGWTPGIKIVHFHGPKPGNCLDCLVISTAEHRDLAGCQCHHVYYLLWNKAPDGGSFYTGALLLFYHYRLQAQQAPASPTAA